MSFAVVSNFLRTFSKLSLPQLSALIGVVFLCAGGLTWLFPYGVYDFSQDYVAAYALRNGLSIYGPHITEMVARYTEGLSNFHPPINALLFLPFTFLPYWQANPKGGAEARSRGD